MFPGFLSAIWEYKKSAAYNLEEGLIWTLPCWHPNLWLRPPETWERNFYCLQATQPLKLVTAGLRHQLSTLLIMISFWRVMWVNDACVFSNLKIMLDKRDSMSFYLWACIMCTVTRIKELSWWLSGKESACQCRRYGFDPWVGKTPWRKKWQPTPIFLPGKLHGQRALVGYSPWGHERVRHDLTTNCHHHHQHVLTPISLPVILLSVYHYTLLTRKLKFWEVK